MANYFRIRNSRGARRLGLLCLTLVLLLSLALPAFASEVPDLDKPGSISLTMRYEGKTVGGGTMTLYRVGDIAEDDGNYFFQLNDFFAPSGVSVEDPTSPEAALALQRYAQENKAEGVTLTISKDGQVTFADVMPGLYLLSQEKAATGYNPAAPFLVSVPMNEDGQYVYDVNATPKVSLTPEPTTQPTKPTVPSTPLPQTGQAWIPIIVLAAVGLVLVLVGWILSKREKKKAGDTPDASDTANTSDTPANSDAPDVPDTPDAPEAPDTPDTPDVPEAPDTPDTTNQT